MKQSWAMLALAAAMAAAVDARACPNCVRGLSSPEASANGNSMLAYNISIGFMLAAPASIFAGFAAAVWRLSRARDFQWEEQRGRGASSETSMPPPLGELR